MSPMWIIAATVLVVGAVLVGRLINRTAGLAADVVVVLAEASEALVVVETEHRPFGDAVGHLGMVAGGVGGPIRASRAGAAIAKLWWRRARQRPPIDVPSQP